MVRCRDFTGIVHQGSYPEFVYLIFRQGGVFEQGLILVDCFCNHEGQLGNTLDVTAGVF